MKYIFDFSGVTVVEAETEEEARAKFAETFNRVLHNIMYDEFRNSSFSINSIEEIDGDEYYVRDMLGEF